jgi:ADP-ribosyl-[dinitrogen reductase] hydrolase
MTGFLPLDEVLDRSRAAFLGMAIGDALGATVEFLTPGEIQARHGRHEELSGGGWLRLKPGQVTDDTEMALCIARAIDRQGEWSLPAIADNFAAWLKAKPVDIGDTCRRGIRRYLLTGQLEAPFNEYDAGNGAAMRLLPVALFTLGDDSLLRRQVVAQARLTHHHPLSDAACICLGRLVHLAVAGASRLRLRREVDRLLADHPTFRFEPYRGLATGYVVDTFQTVFHHFFRTRDFFDGLVCTVNQGGDADTTGAIAGMLAGAYYGTAGIPRKWLKRLDRKLVTEISELAERLVRLSPLGTGTCL